MSIYDEIDHRVNLGHLAWAHHSKGDPIVRKLLLGPEIHRLATGPWIPSDFKLRCAELWTDFERYMSGARMMVGFPVPGEHPRKRKRAAQLRLLWPEREGVWEIRSAHSDEKKAIRVFGHFIEKDVFVVFTWYWRKDLPAGDWNFQRKECRAEWRKFFPCYSPLIGVPFDDHISNAKPI